MSTQIPDPIESATLEPDPAESTSPTDVAITVVPLNPTGQPTANPDPTNPTGTAQSGTKTPPILYYSQAGDVLDVVAIRFGVLPADITSPDPIPTQGLLQPGQLLIIPSVLGETTPADELMPDSEIVYSPSAVDFDTKKYVKDAGGYLNSFKQYLKDGWYTGAEVIQRVAIENSVNPRLLLALLEYQSHWVFGQPANLAETDYPMGFTDFSAKGLYAQLSWAVNQLSDGYYGWREGHLTDLVFTDKSQMRLDPGLNAGTVAVLYLFSKLNDQPHWGGMVYGTQSFSALHKRLFGDPWLRAETVEPLYPQNLTQPKLELPFQAGHTWSLTGGPHYAWDKGGAWAAMDFAPMSSQSGCVVSNEWVTAAAAGLIVRSTDGVVVEDLDGDGYEQTGWDLMYLHVAPKDQIKAGTWVSTNDRIGHPSCEGGEATGTHVHFARKYNGEWIAAGGPLPMTLSGWVAQAGNAPYIGSFTKGNQTANACPCGSSDTLVTRPQDDN
ncbi:MAG: hypothetical protein P4L50_13385 [Anaerolineaceae bacterium]|nr:hypothetical protein [Anaerolineaceae bacterium]